MLKLYWDYKGANFFRYPSHSILPCLIFFNKMKMIIILNKRDRVERVIGLKSVPLSSLKVDKDKYIKLMKSKYEKKK